MSRHWLGLLLLAIWFGAARVAHTAITPGDDPLDVGTVVVGQSRTASTSITADINTLDVSVVVHGGVACAEFSITAPTGPVTINNGNHVAVTVQLAPTSPGPKSCVIDVKQGTNVLTSFTAKGTTQAPTIQIDQSPTFTATEVGKSSTAQLKLTNSGTSPLTIRGGGGRDAGAGPDGRLIVALAALIAVRRRQRRAAHGSIALAATAAATLALTPTVQADGIGLTVFAPTPAVTGEGFALQTPDVGAPGSWAANAVVSYASNPLVDGDRGLAPVGRSTLLQLGAAYALLDRFELGACLPLYLQSGDAVHGTALGDLALHAKARLWRGDTAAGALVTGASAIVMLPTATKDQFTGSDQPEAHLLLLGSFTPAMRGARLALSVNAGAVLRSTSSSAEFEQRSGMAWGAGASVRVVPRLWVTAELFGEITPWVHLPGPSSVTLSQIEGLAGVSIKPDRRFTLGLALGRGMTSAPGTPDLRGVLSLSVVPGAAPAEPIHPHVPDIAPVAEADTDGDGIPDAQDKCPNDPGDKDGFQDADGCPDPDNDGDGIPDAQDRCPNDPEDRDGFQDADGCPDPDNDHDGIPDARDKCPNEPETVNGFQDDDGCPDSLPAADPAAATKAAEATFAKGRDLMAQSHYAAACAAFEQSQRLDPQFGTQFNLAICYDKLGKLATAWNLYRELARSDSNAARRARAGQTAAALASRVPKLRLVLPNRPDGVQVLLNGVDASALLGLEAPVDAGHYTVAATAPGHRPWQGTVEAQDGRVVTVVIDLRRIP